MRVGRRSKPGTFLRYYNEAHFIRSQTFWSLVSRHLILTIRAEPLGFRILIKQLNRYCYLWQARDSASFEKTLVLLQKKRNNLGAIPPLYRQQLLASRGSFIFDKSYRDYFYKFRECFKEQLFDFVLRIEDEPSLQNYIRGVLSVQRVVANARIQNVPKISQAVLSIIRLRH